MKTILICPSCRPSVPQLGECAPLAAGAILGKSLAEYWLEYVAAQGARHVLLVAADRPDQVSAAVGDGSRWGLRIELVREAREIAPDEARAKHRAANDAEWLKLPDDAILMDHLPGLAGHPLFETYSGWFAALQAFLPRAATPDRIGRREIQPGVWTGLTAVVAPSAQLNAPCWIGDHAIVGANAAIGPGAFLEDCVLVGSGARISHSAIGPGTFVGDFTLVENSIAMGATLTNWRNSSCLQVTDEFILCSLRKERAPTSIARRFRKWLARSFSSSVASVSLESNPQDNFRPASKLNAL